MYQCPITYFKDNLIFNADKSVWAAYKLTGYEYEFLDDEVKISILYKTARFLTGIMSDAQILIVPVEQDTKEQFNYLRSKLDKSDPLYEQALFHANQTEAYLRAKKDVQGQANDYRSYILVKLADYTDSELVDSLKSSYEFFVKNPMNAINVLMNLDSKDILMSKLNSAIKKAESWQYAQNKKIRLVELDSMETQWILRRVAFRGLNKRIKLFQTSGNEKEWQPKAEVKEVGTERIIKPYGKDIVNLFSGSIHAEKRAIRVEHDKNIVSYQTFLTLTNIPDAFEYPGTEWIYMLQAYNMQAEVCIHIKAIEHRDAKRKLDAKKQEIDQQMQYIAEANAAIPEDLQLGIDYAQEMEAEIKNLREPILNTSVTICLADTDRESLEKKVVTVRNAYENINFILERPLADQVNLFLQCIPTVGCIVKDYTLPMTPLTLASGVIGATHELGDREGPYIATTGAGEKEVYLELGQACLRNKSAAATFFGNLGVGKSFNANLLIVLNVLYGGYGMIFDPKAERSHWASDLHILQGLITTVTLSGDPVNKGKLDPYNVYRDDPRAADELAVNVLSELLKIEPTSIEYTAILEAQRLMREKELPSMQELITCLNSFPEDDELRERAKLLARRLKLQAQTGMNQLLFGDGTEEAITLDNRLNILQIDNLKLPSPEVPKENYTSEELLSTVLMAVISNFAKRFAMVKRPVFKMLLFDESWMLGKTVEGVKLYEFLTRMGRSLYTGCIFNGHSVLDLPTEGIKNTISYKFCFQTTNDAEASRMCEYMGMEATMANMETFKTLGNGECLFQDLDGHVGILHFDAVFQDLIDVFSTTPKTKRDKQPKETPETPQDNLTAAEEPPTVKRQEEKEAARTEPAEEIPAEQISAEQQEEPEEDEDWEISLEELYRKEVL